MFNERELLDTKIQSTTPLKEYIVNYVGNKLISSEENTDGVTVEMIIQVLADDFPEIVLALAEENFFRGYRQGLSDSDSSRPVDKNNDIQE